MRNSLKFSGILLSLLLLATLVNLSCAKYEAGPPPPTDVEIVVDTIHGMPIEDPYRWLEDQESEKTRNWIDAQNEYTQSFLNAFPDKEKLQNRLTELMKIDRITMPSERNGRYFLYKRDADQDQYVIYMREGLEGEDQVLIDPHTMDSAHTTSVGMMNISRDGKLMAYSIRTGGEDEVAVRFLDIDTRKELADVFPRADYFGLSINNDKSGVYYSLFDKDIGCRVYYHAFGTDMAKDKLLFGEGYGPEIIIGAGLSEDGRYLIIPLYYGSAGNKSDVYYMDVTEKKPKVKTLVNDIDAKFYADVAGDKVYMQTNWEAPNWRIIEVDLKKPAKKYWKEVIPVSDGVINGFSLVGGKIYVNYLENVNSRVKIFDAEGKQEGEISFPSIGTVGGVYGHWDGNEAFFMFTSFHIPTTIYHYDVASGEQKIWYQQEVKADTDIIDVEQVWFESKDGTKVPMFVVHRKDIKLDGNNPVYLTAYGGFNASWTPYFSSTAVFWVEQGGVFAIPNIRGGGEFGDEWHRDAMFEKKQNSFDDFIAAAEWLIDNKYTNPSKLCISGGSNGGLLVGAALTQRPDLFKAVLCTYPLLDMLRYHNFLMGPFWVSEYGSADDSVQFKYIYEYSPYHHVKQGTAYPAVLFVTGDSDTRVAPLHARKMTALLQSATGSNNPVMIYYDTKAGHSGGTPLSKTIEETTLQVGFLMWQLGVRVK